MQVIILPVTPIQANCVLLICGATRKTVIIDPGGELDRIEAALAQADAVPDRILVTHAHVDHAAGVAGLARRLSVPVEGPQRGDQYWIDVISRQGREFGFDYAEAFTPDRWLEQGDVVEFGDMRLDVHHCPGHTPGHVIYHQPENGLAIVGDVIFQGSIGRTDFPGGDFQTLVRSIRERIWPLGDSVQLITGHGPVTTVGHERMTNPFVGEGARA